MEKVSKHDDKIKLLASKDDVERIGGTVRTCTSDNSFLIGQGSHGTCVYLGIDDDGNPVAVKRILTATAAHLQSVEKETKLLDLLKLKRSKHIVSYRDFKQGDPFSYVILDLCEETLASFVQRKDKDYLEIHGPEIIKEILTGLQALHSGGNKILHMDLKPENILVDSDDHMRLADFGISRKLNYNQTTITTGSKGTLGWMAAESLPKEGEMEGRFKRKSDIQVVGMISFYILTKGEHPFGDMYRYQGRISNILHGKPVHLKKLTNTRARKFVKWLIQRDPKNRPYAEEALKDPFLQPNAGELSSPTFLCRARQFVWQLITHMWMWEPVRENIPNLNFMEECEMPDQFNVLRRRRIQQKEQGGKISYISKGFWVSKLVVQYINDKNELVKHEATASSCPIEIPEKAKDIEVRFEVLRFIATWCDVKKYHRFEKCWCEPTEPHIFKYNKPVTRTFTIDGGLYYEAVMKVCDDGNHEVDDM